MKFPVMFLSVCLFTASHAAAQDSSDTSLVNNSVAAVRSQYMKNIAENSYLYNGVAFERYWTRIIGTPFYIDENFRRGSLWYNGSFYDDVQLMYDLNNDAVISKNFQKNVSIKLLSEKIHAFTIGSNYFVRVGSDSAAKLTTGFYEKLYEGSYTVLAKYSKIIRLSKAEENTARFVDFNYYYITRDGIYTPVRSESDLQNVFRDQRAEIRKFMNRKEIDFKKNPGDAIVQTVKYYEQLKK